MNTSTLITGVVSLSDHKYTKYSYPAINITNVNIDKIILVIFFMMLFIND